MTKPGTTKAIRCAIYTRKSSEEGLDQAFNSLHAQREACEAYIKSQVAEGWRVSPASYDDGGFSGGNLARPALEKLLADVDAGLIDTVVVYKVDRLTRSLSDFAKIVDRLDAASASFVSVTQAFNTTNSMGRLTLNVLLSFAQFEREVTGERIRDKIAASKQKGMWMGGVLPLGYDAPTDPTTRALVLNEAEADVVRDIFRTYLELGSVHGLEARLDAQGVRSKVWRTRSGKLVGGSRLVRGALFHLLKNRVYLGEIKHGQKSYPASHPPIIDEQVFEAVQATLASHRQGWRTRPLRAATMPLKGLIFDADGSAMSPSFTHGRNGQLYRYYVSTQLQQGRAKRRGADLIRRVSAGEIEGLIKAALERRFQASDAPDLSKLLSGVKRIDLETEAVRITFIRSSLPRSALSGAQPDAADPALVVVTLPVRCRVRGGRTSLVGLEGADALRRSRRDSTLINALQFGHRVAASMGWRSADGTLDQIRTVSPSNPYHRKLCCLVFLAPDIQRRIVEGRQPRTMNLERLLAEPMPVCWKTQRRLFGIAEY